MEAKPPEKFLRLKAEIESHRRLSGYYLIKWVELSRFCAHEIDRAQLLDDLFQFFDDQKWPPIEHRPKDQSWADYATDMPTARRMAVDALAGGTEVGHLRDTISRNDANDYFDRFDALFPAPKRYYIEMGLVDPKYVFMHGVAIVSNDSAGLLWVVESD